MTHDQFDSLRPWHDGGVTDAGYRPPRSLVRLGYLRHQFDNFYALTTKGLREVWRISELGAREQ